MRYKRLKITGNSQAVMIKNTDPRILLATLFFILSATAKSESLKINNYDHIRISLLSSSPGEDVSSVFGHSAIRVSDRLKNSDLIYNYGTFDFDDPLFYVKFIQGKLEYQLSVTHFQHVTRSMTENNRSLIESPFNVSAAEKKNILAFLTHNYRPENRFYRYDFLADNCATKIIHVLDNSISDSLALNPHVIPDLTFRHAIDEHLKHRPWLDAGIDLLLGAPTDRHISPYEAAFMPEYLHLIVKNTRIINQSGKQRPLTKSDFVHVRPYSGKTLPKFQPKWLLWSFVLLFLISTVFNSHFEGFFIFFEKILFLTFGILGAFILFMWICTEHYVFGYNTDLLWANPLLLLFFFTKPEQYRKRKWNHAVLLITALLAAIGPFTTYLIEDNLNLTALSILNLLSLIRLIVQVEIRARNADLVYGK